MGLKGKAISEMRRTLNLVRDLAGKRMLGREFIVNCWVWVKEYTRPGLRKRHSCSGIIQGGNGRKQGDAGVKHPPYFKKSGLKVFKRTCSTLPEALSKGEGAKGGGAGLNMEGCQARQCKKGGGKKGSGGRVGGLIFSSKKIH